MSLEMFVSLFAFLGLVASWVMLPNGRRGASGSPKIDEPEAEARGL